MPSISRKLAPPIAARFRVIDPNGQERSCRVTGYYKQTRRPTDMDWVTPAFMGAEDHGQDHVLLIHCCRKEAEFVSGSDTASVVKV
ncbi:hypothetical protein [Geoalkalibacter subterraneus]|uniref:Uncharacterized protein n=1 Tax=Geoalkalibacter subterraneus TaxID=483547 RepID=A0A0B5FU68_9BACT|nr:hypothetical protein [Geoalkalibacter subterraneus]AJF08204.1 hypothetical protein GSUB_17090 [Geoalkalibacter subterraneus]